MVESCRRNEIYLIVLLDSIVTHYVKIENLNMSIICRNSKCYTEFAQSAAWVILDNLCSSCSVRDMRSKYDKSR